MVHVYHGYLLRAACVRNLRSQCIWVHARHRIATISMAAALTPSTAIGTASTPSIAVVSTAVALTRSTAMVSMATASMGSAAMVSRAPSMTPCLPLVATPASSTVSHSRSTLPTGWHSCHDCLTSLDKVTNWVHPFDGISSQRWCTTMRESCMQEGEDAEGKPQPMSKALDSGKKVPVRSQKHVVVVETPAKAKVIRKYLGTDFVVLPSYGHVRDLAARAGSIRPDDDYAMVWEVPEAAQPHMTSIKNACKGAKCLVLATDPDREGEAIAWHVFEVMKAEGIFRSTTLKVVRVAFNEVTKKAVLNAMQAPRDICLSLVNAYLARRAVDYLTGFALSPLLWRKLPGSQSVGRVPSTALKLVCEREKAIEEFVPQEYWTVESFASWEGLTDDEVTLFPVQPICLDGKEIKKFPLSCHSAKLLEGKLKSAILKVSTVTKGLKRRNPPEPYSTSTLQQDAEAKLGFGVGQTMTLAQKLYEGVNLDKGELTGLITFVRTDGRQLSKEAVRDICAVIAQRFGYDYISPNVREFNTRGKNNQEAHEAIRPTNMQRLPSALCHTLDKDALALYSLIWTRTMECQMEQALYDEVTVDFMTEDGAVSLRATGSHLAFPGFLAARKDKQDFLDFEAAFVAECQDLASESWTRISALKKGDVTPIKKAEAQQHFTCSPARYSEGLLVKAMEEVGIGRPSTYASTLRTLQARKYVKVENHQIIPEVRGLMATAFLSHYLPRFADYNFTALVEEQLDEVSGGRLQWKQVLREFWPTFHADVSSILRIPIQEVVEVLQEAFLSYCFTGLGVKGRACPRCKSGKLNLKVSRYGSGYFLGCGDDPLCRFKAQVISNGDADSLTEERLLEHKVVHLNILLGVDPATNLEVRLRTGPFGGYIQLGDDGKGKEFFRIPPGVEPAEITMEKAIQLMKYPKKLGKHPEDGNAVILGLNKKSYVIKHGGFTAIVPKGENVEGITLERALQLLKGKNVTRKGRKTLAKLAAEAEERKQKDHISVAKVLEKHTFSGVATGSKTEVVGVNRVNADRAEADRKQSSGKRKTTKVASEGRRVKMVSGRRDAEDFLEAGVAHGDVELGDIGARDTASSRTHRKDANGQDGESVYNVEGSARVVCMSRRM